MKIEKALVVDDSRVAHLNLRKLLTERNIEVDWVGSGEDCLVYLRRQKPDIVFMDVMMPGMDGFDTAGMINNDSSINAPPVVMCSANATDEDRRNAEKNGAVEFLSKPYTAEKLDQVLAMVSELTMAAVAQPEQVAAQQHHAAPEVPVVRQPEIPHRPQAEVPSSPQPEKSATPVFDLPRITQAAERAARSAAEETARKVAAELARVAAEKTVRLAIKESEAIARSVAKEVTGEAARPVAEETAQAVAEKVARRVCEGITEQISAVQNDAVDLDSIQKGLQAEVAQQVQDALRWSMTGDDFTRYVTQAIEKTTGPLLESSVKEIAAQTAERIAIQVLEEATRPSEEDGQASGRKALARANLALAAGMIALIVVVALKFVVL